jgi:hypothetical protein
MDLDNGRSWERGDKFAFIYLTKVDVIRRNNVRQGSDETSIRREITDAMLAAGVVAYVDWKDRRKSDASLSRTDLVAAVFVAMRRAASGRS